MAKGKDVKKEVKKKPEKSLKEKREEKKAKKAQSQTLMREALASFTMLLHVKASPCFSEC